MNVREVLTRSKVSADLFVPATKLRNFVIDSHFETNHACSAGKFTALKPAKGAQGE
jgi:hypothetical protein